MKVKKLLETDVGNLVSQPIYHKQEYYEKNCAREKDRKRFLLFDTKKTGTENYICQKTNSISREIFLYNFDIYKK